MNMFTYISRGYFILTLHIFVQFFWKNSVVIVKKDEISVK